MSIAQRCQHHFLSGDRSRGENYFDEGRVSLRGGADGAAYFEARGNQIYDVEVEFHDLNRGLLRAWCDCPRFQDGTPCKHVWAALLQVDEVLDLPKGKKLKLSMQTRGEPVERNSAQGREVMQETVARIDAPDQVPNRDASPQKRKATRKASAKSAKKPKQKPWLKGIRRLANAIDDGDVNHHDNSTLERFASKPSKLLFALVQEDYVDYRGVLLRLYRSTRKADGGWGVPQKTSLGSYELGRQPSHHLELLQLLVPFFDGYHSHVGEFTIADNQYPEAVLAHLANLGSLFWTMQDDTFLRDAVPLKWDERSFELELGLRLEKQGRKQIVRVQPQLTNRQGESLAVDQIKSAYEEGILLIEDRLLATTPATTRWLSGWQRSEEIVVPRTELDAFLDEFTKLRSIPTLVPDDALDIETVVGKPQGKLVLEVIKGCGSESLRAAPEFVYGETTVPADSDRMVLWDQDARQLLQRDKQAESALEQQLLKYQFDLGFSANGESLSVPAKQVPALTHELVDLGWQVVVQGKLVRQFGSINISVESEQDWFDLDAKVDYDGLDASLPALLEALRSKQTFVQLDDGTQGILPEEWLNQFERYLGLGDVADDKLRFAKTQAMLLDGMLAEQENVKVDRDFTKLCKQLQNFEGIKPGKEPRGFQGELRDYQRDDVGWLQFLRDFRFGGCLADDMGTGKTVQVLAMLEQRRTRRLKKNEQRFPSLVVVPKSLVFNWIDEAEKFAPKLKVLNFTGIERKHQQGLLDTSDVIVTTYGTLRRDIELLVQKQFDYVILDESQAIKNADSQAAKACRLLNADYRLAMTGTPIENHLGELWSLFEFLNPGMFGSSNYFRQAINRKKLPKANDGEEPEKDDRLEWLSRAIRPFILRRTKQQVLTQLPEKTEQTLHVDMTPKQKKKYNELKDYYRAHLNKKVEELGIKRSKIHVLEALLRLRQAACDPRLLGDKEPSGAKLELLFEQLDALREDGHKALIFSQFTSLLQIVRNELDEQNWNYEYLDGKTRKRAEKVKRFQNDEDCQLFLISLKAGGSGLNLTAADYVFILDPWWNPAAEAQAIDRAHRIGQTKPVMAYRIICNDTVEEKIVNLQTSKRELANAIITADKSLISALSFDDLQMLLG